MSKMMQSVSMLPVWTLLLCGSLAVGSQVRAEDKSAAWTDPPVRGVAAPQTSDRGRSEQKPASTQSSERAEGTVAPDGARIHANASRNGERENATERKADRPPQTARLRQDKVRRVPARMRPDLEQNVVQREVVVRSNSAERSLKASPVRSVATSQMKAASRIAQRSSASKQMSRRDVLAERHGRKPVRRFDQYYAMGGERSAYRGYGYEPYRAVRGDDPFDDDRADRIASARAAGYLVMRSRTYTYSDGARFQSVRPYFPEDPGIFE